MTAALARVRIGRIAADAGYDSEPNHAFARQECQRPFDHSRQARPAHHQASHAAATGG